MKKIMVILGIFLFVVVPLTASNNRLGVGVEYSRIMKPGLKQLSSQGVVPFVSYSHSFGSSSIQPGVEAKAGRSFMFESLRNMEIWNFGVNSTVDFKANSILSLQLKAGINDMIFKINNSLTHLIGGGCGFGMNYKLASKFAINTEATLSVPLWRLNDNVISSAKFNNYCFSYGLSFQYLF